MSNACAVNGQITIGSPCASDCSFPTGTTQIPFSSSPGASVQTGDKVKALASANAFVALSGIGTGGDVTQALFLFVNAQTAIQLRLTCTGIAGMQVIPCQGPTLITFPAANPLVLLEAMGTATVEYFACGNS